MDPDTDASDASTAARIFGQVAHDLRTPLGSLALWLHQLREDQGDPDAVARVLPMIESGSRALARFARDLDEAAAMLRGDFTLRSRSLDLRSVLATSLAALRPRAATKEVTLREALGAESAVVRADPDRLGRALDALLETAVAKAQPGTGVSIELERQAAEAAFVMSPPPVGPEGLPELRERLLTSSTGRGGGLHLPLALARHILAAHQARIDANDAALRITLLVEPRGAAFPEPPPVPRE
jgi:signal transduction histidine kinase